MTNEFAVIGHHRDDAEALLLIGADGHHYRYHLIDNRLESVDSADGWVLETGADSLFLSADQETPSQFRQ